MSEEPQPLEGSENTAFPYRALIRSSLENSKCLPGTTESAGSLRPGVGMEDAGTDARSSEEAVGHFPTAASTVAETAG